MDSLSEKYGNNFILSLVSNGLSSDESSVGRQTLQAADNGVKGSTKPRSQEFPVFFIIIATFTVLMLFILLFISYEMAYMGPGDNIAYKLGAAASKKNQECSRKSTSYLLLSWMAYTVSFFSKTLKVISKYIKHVAILVANSSFFTTGLFNV